MKPKTAIIILTIVTIVAAVCMFFLYKVTFKKEVNQKINDQRTEPTTIEERMKAMAEEQRQDPDLSKKQEEAIKRMKVMAEEQRQDPDLSKKQEEAIKKMTEQ